MGRLSGAERFWEIKQRLFERGLQSKAEALHDFFSGVGLDHE